MSITLYPAIDVREGRVVRLAQGDYARETRYATDPFAQAMTYADAGAAWLHLVDLDAAREGGYTLLPLLSAIADDGRLQVQTGGGIRDEADVRRLLDGGAARVVIGSRAVDAPELVAGWIRRFGSERIVVALDARQHDDGTWQLPTHGWTRHGGTALDAMLTYYAEADATHVLSTDIARDGMLQGPNVDLYARVTHGWPRFAVQASGGVRDAADIEAARAAGCRGVVLGKALLEGRIALAGVLPQAVPC